MSLILYGTHCTNPNVWLAAYVSTTSTKLVVSNKGRQGGYSLRTGTID